MPTAPVPGHADRRPAAKAGHRLWHGLVTAFRWPWLVWRGEGRPLWLFNNDMVFVDGNA
jgi:hypothetical protein